jgi:hypothetical protein
MNADLCAGCGRKIPTWRSKLARFCDSKCRDKHVATLRRKGRSAADKSRDDRIGERAASKESVNTPAPAVGGQP